MVGRLLSLAGLLPMLGACNMAISETTLFVEADAATLEPRDGVWIADDPECRFDSNLPESDWPDCAMWAALRSSGGELLFQNGKGESQPARWLIAQGQPTVVQILWHDEAKEDGKTFYVFFGIEPGPVQPDSRFVVASSWEVKCGIQDPSSSEIKPYPGITSECRPTSKEAVRSAASASRPSAEMAMRWHWLRAESR